MRRKILQLLMDSGGNYVSGESICKELGISRAAVWKHIKALKNEDYDIISLAGRGYRLNNMPDTLDFKAILCSLKTKNFGHNLEIHESIDSTNSRAKILALNGAAEGSVVVADHQTAGRGRMDRTWISPAKKGLWMSIVLRPAIAPQRAQELTVLSAVAILKTLNDNFCLNAEIKWPNDIVLKGKKLCGILSEIHADPDSISSVVTGIGINVNMQIEDFPPELKDTATSILIETTKSVSRRELLLALLENLETFYTEFIDFGGLKQFLDYYKSNSATLGRKVEVFERSSKFHGKAIDIDEFGALIVQLYDGSIRRVLSADVTVRGENSYV